MYKRKTRDTWELWVWYGAHGWEHETTELSRKEAKAQVKCYRENVPQYPIKVVKRRERITQ